MRDVKGRFLPGPDKDRHRFTRTEQQFGYFVTMNCRRLPSRIKAYVRSKITGYYQDRARARSLPKKD